MAVTIKKNVGTDSITVGNSIYPTGLYKLTFGKDDVTITPLYPNMGLTTLNFKMDNVVDADEAEFADMDEFQDAMIAVFFNEVTVED